MHCPENCEMALWSWFHALSQQVAYSHPSTEPCKSEELHLQRKTDSLYVPTSQNHGGYAYHCLACIFSFKKKTPLPRCFHLIHHIVKTMTTEAGMVAQQANPKPAMPVFPKGNGLSPSCSTLIQLSANGLAKEWRKAQGLGLLHACGRLEASSPPQLIAVIWGLNQRMEDLFLSHFLSFSL